MRDGVFSSSSGGRALWRAARKHASLEGVKQLPPIWRELRAMEELRTLRRDPLSRGAGIPHGRGLPVLLIPGYLAGDGSLEPLAEVLRSAGYRPARSGVRLNVGCAGEMFGSIEARLSAHVAASEGRKAVLIGQSRGGGFARWLATRRPDLVAGIVTLGTPLRDPLALHPLVLAHLGLVSAVGTLGVRGILSTRCLRLDRCCAAVWRGLRQPIAREIPFLSIYSRSDGIVDWRACLDPAARHLEVDSSHCGMAFNVDVVRAIGAELAGVVEGTSASITTSDGNPT